MVLLPLLVFQLHRSLKDLFLCLHRKGGFRTYELKHSFCIRVLSVHRKNSQDPLIFGFQIFCEGRQIVRLLIHQVTLHQVLLMLVFQLLHLKLPNKQLSLYQHQSVVEHKRILLRTKLLLRELQHFLQRQYSHIHRNNDVLGILLRIYLLKDFPLLLEHLMNNSFQKQLILSDFFDFLIRLQLKRQFLVQLLQLVVSLQHKLSLQRLVFRYKMPNNFLKV